MFFGLYPKDASYTSDEVSLALFRLAKNTALSVLVGIFGAVFAIPTAESRLTCVRDEGQQLRCDEAQALLGFWEVRKRALPGLGKEEIRSHLVSHSAEGPGIGEAEIADFVSGRGPAKIRAVKRVPLSPVWWSICSVLVITALFAILWFPIELYYWLSHKEGRSPS